MNATMNDNIDDRTVLTAVLREMITENETYQEDILGNQTVQMVMPAAQSMGIDLEAPHEIIHKFNDHGLEQLKVALMMGVEALERTGNIDETHREQARELLEERFGVEQ